jgi:hypothetical protein
MRARWLKPEFFTDKKIGPLGMCAALVFEALWCCADDGGAAECEPVLLKGQMFIRWPEISVEAIEQALQKLADAKRIVRYHHGDREFALIKSWEKNQPVHNPSKFRYPRPDHAVTPSNDVRLQQSSGSADAVVRPSSHPRLPDAHTPQLPNSQTPKSSGASSASVPYLEEFEEIFAAYPKRAGGDSKREGYLQFRARIQAGATPAEILAGVKRYAAYCRATDKVGTEYVKQLRTFLGKSRYYLEPWTLPRTAGTRPSPTPATNLRQEDALIAEFNTQQRDAALQWAKDHPVELQALEEKAEKEIGLPSDVPGYEVVRRQFLTQKSAEAAGFPTYEEWLAAHEVHAA